ncbi:AAA family ATPase [Pseudoalteromonas sp. MMG012]|uniref:ExeA family protein n=1 Tax=Pseudoalteromonas sp. MMG012 TaxID=2822686 RepID=UPI001B3A6AAB|nr:AAA family ATPase [Pseudoalteromonas sp. MMG012]MBQ4851030.1 AAA family ATPase [Pseudoalteromonas sp. MMG012]
MTKQTKLSVVFDVLSIKQAQVVRALAAKGIKFSTTSLSRLKTQNEWPKQCKRADIEQHIIDYLRAHGATDDHLMGLFGWNEPKPKHAQNSEEDEMLKAQLKPDTKKFFKIRRDPFNDEFECEGDFFLVDSHLQIIEELIAAARANSMVTLTGECGSGKSMIRRLFEHKVKEEFTEITVISPARINRKKITADGVSRAICRELGIKNLNNGEDRDEEISRTLIERSRSGHKHLLIVDQAQDLTPDLIRELKCVWETMDGFKRVIGIVLFGQPELRTKIQAHSMREFNMRVHDIRMPPLGLNAIDYMKHKFTRIGVDPAKIFTDDALSAIRGKCYGKVGKGIGFDDENQDQTYPLAINVWLAHTLNIAATIGVKHIDEKFVHKV